MKMKRKVSLIMALFLLAAVFGSAAWASEVHEPLFSAEGGIYETEFELSIDGGGCDVYYTMDGSEPSLASKRYTEPIKIEDISRSPRTVQGKVAQGRFGKGIVVKAVCIDTLGNKSDIVTNTYFVSDYVREMAGYVPVISISADPNDLWHWKDGIYSNFNQDKKIPAYAECFDKERGGFERKTEMKIGGHYSKVNPKKSLRLYFTKGDPNSKNLEYDLIEGTDRNFYDASKVKKYGKVTFRISDWDSTDLRDRVAQSVTEFMRPESANSEPAAVFLNGEFWGIYELREQYDNRYLDYHYEGIDKDEVVYIDRDWTNENSEYVLSDTGEKMTDRFTYEEGPKEDEKYYEDLFNYTKYLMEHAGEEENYRELKGYMDIDNFIDYIFVYLYLDNIDWPGNNYKTWRTTMERSTGDVYAADGRWRFMIHDFDIAFDNPRSNTLEYATAQADDTDPRHPAFASRTLGGMFESEEFRERFAQRAAAYMATAVSPENVESIVEKLISEREHVKAFDLTRWDNMRGTVTERLNGWRAGVRNLFVQYAKTRAELFDDMIIDFLKKHYQSNISETTDFTFNIDSSLGSVDISGAVIRESLYGDKAKSFTTKQFTNIPLTIGAETKEGYKVESVTIEEDGKATVYTGGSVTLTPKKASYKVTINIAKGTEQKSEAKDFYVMREKRFRSMVLGEKLPVEIISDEGEKLFGFSCRAEGDAVSVGVNNILTAEKAGKAKVIVTYKNIIREIEIEVK